MANPCNNTPRLAGRRFAAIAATREHRYHESVRDHQDRDSDYAEAWTDQDSGRAQHRADNEQGDAKCDRIERVALGGFRDRAPRLVLLPRLFVALAQEAYRVVGKLIMIVHRAQFGGEFFRQRLDTLLGGLIGFGIALFRVSHSGQS